MQRTVRALRIALPILFVAFIVLIVATWRRNNVKPDKTAAVPVVMNALFDTAVHAQPLAAVTVTTPDTAPAPTDDIVDDSTNVHGAATVIVPSRFRTFNPA